MTIEEKMIASYEEGEEFWVETWKFFLYRYLAICNGLLDFQFLRLWEGSELIKDSRFVLSYFIEACDDLGIEIEHIGCGTTLYNLIFKINNLDEFDPDFSQAHKDLNDKLVEPLIDGGGRDDLPGLLKLAHPYEDDMIKSLIIKFKLTSASKERINKILEFYAKNYAEDKIKIGDYFQKMHYSYQSQKSNFLRNAPAIIRQFGTKVHMTEKNDFTILGEDTDRITFLPTLITLEYEGYIKIKEMNFYDIGRFKRKPNVQEDLVVDFEFNKKAIPLSESTKPIADITPPANWNLELDDSNPKLSKNGHEVFSFGDPTSNQFRYFKCLWMNYGKKIAYRDIYEYDCDLKYPDKRGENWKMNDNIRRTVRRLQERFDQDNIPIKITTEKGLVLTIDPSISVIST